MKKRTLDYLFIKKCIKLAKQQIGCIEFPAFGATYPDARCIDGQLYDLDDCDGDVIYEPLEYKPCPVCQTKGYITNGLDDGYSRQHLYKHLLFIFKKYGNL
jgi:hypothetical protein